MLNGISTFVGYLMPKPSLHKNSGGTNSWEEEYKEVHTFPKGIIQKVNEIMKLSFELAYFKVTVNHLSYYLTGTPPEVSYLNQENVMFRNGDIFRILP